MASREDAQIGHGYAGKQGGVRHAGKGQVLANLPSGPISRNRTCQIGAKTRNLGPNSLHQTKTAIMLRKLIRPTKKLIQNCVGSLGYEIHRVPRFSKQPGYEPVRPIATYAPWNADELFAQTYTAVRRNTLVDKYRCFELWWLVGQNQKLSGSLIEIGVWRGGTGALIARRAKAEGIAEPVYLCDTFTGVVKAGQRDLHYYGGEHANTSRAIVESLCRKLELDNVTILEGIFPDDTAEAVAGEKFRFCHIDVDAYQSAEDILDWIWDKLVVGGMVVYDDFGFGLCDGIRKHVDRQRTKPDRLLLQNLNGHAVVVKIA